ncbi:hypothetical protein VCHA38O209_80187 [Vibrio chagasii]|nr:hypothetical protein VCHA38O209_80187 [Vibrio chagasii]
MVGHSTDFLGDIALDWAEPSTICIGVKIRKEVVESAGIMKINRLHQFRKTDG